MKKKARLPVAINENTARNAKHTSICCMTGGGKGVAMNTLGIIPNKYPAIIFDPHGEYKKLAGRKVYSYKSRMNFAKIFQKAWVTGKPFILAYAPKPKGKTEKERKQALIVEAHWFASVVWAAADGNRILYAVFEEFGEYAEGNQKDETIIGKIWTGGRKFGVRAIAIFQRSAEVPKTIWNNSPVKVIGAQGGLNDQNRVMKELGCRAADVIDLGHRNVKLSMFAKELDEIVRTKVHYLVSEAGGTFEKVAAYVPQSNYLTKDWTVEQKEIDKGGGYKVAS
jgi:hypothetical protein